MVCKEEGHNLQRILKGDNMANSGNCLVVYIHGKNGSAGEFLHYKSLFPDCDVIGFDYQSSTPWDAQEEFKEFFRPLFIKYEKIIVVAVSFGAYLALNAGIDTFTDYAFFISPVVDMEKLILDMMDSMHISLAELKEKGEIITESSEKLSFDYLEYVRHHPCKWSKPLFILYGGHDNLTALHSIKVFALKTNAILTIMNDGEHWFHTTPQMAFLDRWIIDTHNGLNSYGGNNKQVM